MAFTKLTKLDNDANVIKGNMKLQQVLPEEKGVATPNKHTM